MRGFAVVDAALSPVAGWCNPFESWEDAQEYVLAAERDGEKLYVAVRCVDGYFICNKNPEEETETGSERERD